MCQICYDRDRSMGRLKPCSRCGTRGGRLNRTGLPIRIQTLCHECYNLPEQVEERRKRMELSEIWARAAAIREAHNKSMEEKKDEPEDADRIAELAIFKVAQEKKVVLPPFSTSSVKKQYFRAMKGLKKWSEDRAKRLEAGAPKEETVSLDPCLSASA